MINITKEEVEKYKSLKSEPFLFTSVEQSMLSSFETKVCDKISEFIKGREERFTEFILAPVDENKTIEYDPNITDEELKFVNLLCEIGMDLSKTKISEILYNDSICLESIKSKIEDNLQHIEYYTAHYKIHTILESGQIADIERYKKSTAPIILAFKQLHVEKVEIKSGNGTEEEKNANIEMKKRKFENLLNANKEFEELFKCEDYNTNLDIFRDYVVEENKKKKRKSE